MHEPLLQEGSGALPVVQAVPVEQEVESNFWSLFRPRSLYAQQSPQSREDLESGKLLKLFAALAVVGAVGYVVSSLARKKPGKVGEDGLLVGAALIAFSGVGIVLSGLFFIMSCDTPVMWMIESCKKRCRSEEENEAVERPQEAAQARLH